MSANPLVLCAVLALASVEIPGLLELSVVPDENDAGSGGDAPSFGEPMRVPLGHWEGNLTPYRDGADGYEIHVPGPGRLLLVATGVTGTVTVTDDHGVWVGLGDLGDEPWRFTAIAGKAGDWRIGFANAIVTIGPIVKQPYSIDASFVAYEHGLDVEIPSEALSLNGSRVGQGAPGFRVWTPIAASTGVSGDFSSHFVSQTASESGCNEQILVGWPQFGSTSPIAIQPAARIEVDELAFGHSMGALGPADGAWGFGISFLPGAFSWFVGFAVAPAERLHLVAAWNGSELALDFSADTASFVDVGEFDGAGIRTSAGPVAVSTGGMWAGSVSSAPSTFLFVDGRDPAAGTASLVYTKPDGEQVALADSFHLALGANPGDHRVKIDEYAGFTPYTRALIALAEWRAPLACTSKFAP